MDDVFNLMTIIFKFVCWQVSKDVLQLVHFCADIRLIVLCILIMCQDVISGALHLKQDI